MKKVILIVLILFALGLSVPKIFRNFSLFKDNSPKTVEIDGHKFRIELVANDQERQRGLGGRDSLCVDCGMLFLFERPGTYNFWMKDMRFNLDIIWISGSKIVYMEKNIRYNDPSIKISPQIADKVLEINGGLSDKYAFKVGDSIVLR